MLGIYEQVSEGVLELQNGVSAENHRAICYLRILCLEAASLQSAALFHSGKSFKNIRMAASDRPKASPAQQPV